MERFTSNGKPYYNRFNTVSDISKKLISMGYNSEETFDIALGTVRILEEIGIIETIDGGSAEWFVVQDWEKMF
jgi:hypothetical protein